MPRPRKLTEDTTKHYTRQEKQKRGHLENIIKAENEELYNTKPADFYNKTSATEYKRILKNFEGMGIITNLEKSHLIAYCDSYARAIECRNELKRNGLHSDDATYKKELAYNEEMRKFAKLCGLTIDSRLKLAEDKAKKEELDIINKFGDI